MTHDPMSYSVSYVITSVMFVATFVSLFFFTYVAQIEKDIVQNQMARIVTNIAQPLYLMAPEEQLVAMRTALDNSEIPDDPVGDKEIDDNNAKLVKSSAIVFGSLCGVGIVAIGLMWKFWKKFSITKLLGINALMITVVAIVYFLFISYVVREYYLIDSNYVASVILEMMIKEQQRRSL